MGFKNANCRVKVGAPPRIEYIPSVLHLPEGENTKIKVGWSDDIPFTVKFFRNGEKLVDNARIKMTLFDEFLIIFMGDITKDDVGKSTARVSNQSESTEESFLIYVSGLSGPPMEASEITSHTCKLEWNIPDFDGGSKITHYVVDIRHNEWIVIASSCKSKSFAVQGQEYLFCILATNVNGIDPHHDSVDPIGIKLPHDPPTAPGKPFICAFGGHFVNPSWNKPENGGMSRIKNQLKKGEIGLENWHHVNQYLHSATLFNITNLVEGRSCAFIILAEHDIGCILPSTNS